MTQGDLKALKPDILREDGAAASHSKFKAWIGSIRAARSAG
jgi:hypothetical protein